MGCKYVDEFDFEKDFGFTKSSPRNYKRGGKVEKCSCETREERNNMRKGGATHRPRITKKEAALVEQAAQQAVATGRIPGVPARKRGVPAHSDKPLINKR